MPLTGSLGWPPGGPVCVARHARGQVRARGCLVTAGGSEADLVPGDADIRCPPSAGLGYGAGAHLRGRAPLTPVREIARPGPVLYALWPTPCRSATPAGRVYFLTLLEPSRDDPSLALTARSASRPPR